jgi:ATP-dependent RNA helicase SUPV3L1/SUV3
MEVILKGLGYRGEPRLESEIKPEKAEETTTPQSDTQATSEAEQDLTAKADTENPVKIDNDEGAGSNSMTPAEPEEPKTILIWRYGGKADRNQKQRSDKRHGKPQNGKRNKGQKPNFRGQNSKNTARKEKAADPDSPFAALAALKDSMKSDND